MSKLWVPAIVIGLSLSGPSLAATVTYNTVLPSLPFTSPGYTANGSITANVANTVGCDNGTFTVNATPVAASGPGGSTPPTTNVVTYIGFPAGGFLFSDAGYGSYTITTTTTACGAGVPPSPVVDTVVLAVPDATASIPTLSEWGMILLSGVMGIAAFVTMRRRSTM